MDDRLKRVVAETFSLEIESVDDSASSAAISAWDSVGQLDLVSALEVEFGMSFTPEEILRMDRLDTIRSLLLEKGVETGRD